MSTLRQLLTFWIPGVTTLILACFGNAFAQVSYKVTDLGTLEKDNLGCAMSLNNEGWTEIMAGYFVPGEQDSVPAYPLHGRAVLGVDGFKIDLGTLGGENTWMMWGQINDWAQIVGFSETDVPDPNGEDVCGFGTHLTCRPFLWQFPQMSALQTLGGNNGQASGINNCGQIVGFAENGEVDSTCPAGTTNNRIDLGAFWQNGKSKPRVLVPLGSDPDSIAYGINEQGQAVGYSGTCVAVNHAVVWTNGTPTPLQDLGTGAIAYGINNQAKSLGQSATAQPNMARFGRTAYSQPSTNCPQEMLAP
jgi:probable HAF family extracellular repeat protein